MEYMHTEGVLGMWGWQLCSSRTRERGSEVAPRHVTSESEVAAANTEANPGQSVGERPHASVIGCETALPCVNTSQTCSKAYSDKW